MKRIKIFTLFFNMPSGILRGLVAVLLFLFSAAGSYSQTVRWLAIGELQSPFSEVGAEYETEFNQTGSTSNFLSWPSQYSIDQTLCRAKAVWIGCTNFQDPVEKRLKSVKVVGSGPKSVADPQQIFTQEIKLIGKFPHPDVTVGENSSSSIASYDRVDEYDPTLPCDRMVQIVYNTSIGVTVTKKVMAFGNSEHGNYFINDYVFKNTGIIDGNGTVVSQTLTDAYFYFFFRYALAGMSVGGNGQGSTWGGFSSAWGESTINHSFGEDPGAPEFNDPNSPFYQMRGFYSWYGPSNYSTRTPATYDGDWGCPKLDQPEGGTLGSAKYVGCVTLHADKSTSDKTDDINQPHTTWWIGSDLDLNSNTSQSQYNEAFMADRYAAMTEGKPPVGGKHDDAVEGIYAISIPNSRRKTGGGVSMQQGFGPYTLAPGDSIHIVFAEGASGISWEKGREIGSNWLQWFTNAGTPPLVMPDGTTRTDGNFNEYKRAWVVDAGRDSILKTYRNALNNYNSGYNVPQAPPPPNRFTVKGGGDRIQLSWGSNAASAPHFGGYVIYRSRGNVLDWRTVYDKIYETSDASVTSFDDVTASRGFNYFYYIQSKDDGQQLPGKILYSSLFWTITNTGAVLGRPAITRPPQPPGGDTTNWKMITALGEWDSTSQYSLYDEVNHKGSAFIYFGTDDNPGEPGVDYRNWHQPTLKQWVSGNAFNAFDKVNYNGDAYVTPFSISAGSMLELVRVVPNPYDIRGRFLQFGDQAQYDQIAFYGLPPYAKLKIFTERGDLIWEKDHTSTTGDERWDSKTSSGQIVASGIYILYVETPEGKSVIRKFVIIR